MAIVSPGNPVSDLQAVATFAGSEITDATRQAALAWRATQQGGSTDGRTPPAGVGIWEPGTNLFRRGQCDATADWATNTSGMAVSVDATVPAPFSPQSIKVVCDGTQANQNVVPLTGAGLAAAAGAVATGSVYLATTAGLSYRAFLEWVNTDSTVSAGATSTWVGRDGTWPTVTVGGVVFEVVTPGLATVAAAKTGDRIELFVGINGTRAETFHVAHAELQTGVGVVSPYIATSQGATAARAGARVQVPSSLLNSQQGSWVARIRAGFPSTDTANRRLFSWRDASTNVLELIYAGSGVMSQQSYANGANSIIANQTGAWNTGDSVTAAGTWSGAGTMGVSVNGAAFTNVTVARALSPISAPLLDIGRFASSAQQWINSSVLWVAFFGGVLTNADVAALAALPDAYPSVFPDVAASLSGRWMTYAPVGPRFRRVNVGEPVVIVR